MKLLKRLKQYIQDPIAYSMAGCSCGNQNVKWSEYADHLYCEKCQLNFIPKHNGIFEGPIKVNAAIMSGISFDRVNLLTEEIIKFDLEDYVALSTGKYQLL